MAEILNDLKLAALNISGTSNASPQPTHSDSSALISSNVSLSGLDSGKVFFVQDNSGGPITVTLPGTANVSIGARYTLVQETLDNEDSLIVRTLGGDERFSTGSHALNNNGLVKPAGVENVLTATAAATNCNHSVGSVVDCQVVAPNRWLVKVDAVVTGTGSAAYAFSSL
jgi:hypothetical protein